MICMCSRGGPDLVLQITDENRQSDGMDPDLILDLLVVWKEVGGVAEVGEPLFFVVHHADKVPHGGAGFADGVVDGGVLGLRVLGVPGVVGGEAGFGPFAPGCPAEGASEHRGRAGARGASVPVEEGVQVVGQAHG